MVVMTTPNRIWHDEGLGHHLLTYHRESQRFSRLAMSAKYNISVAVYKELDNCVSIRGSVGVLAAEGLLKLHLLPFFCSNVASKDSSSKFMQSTFQRSLLSHECMIGTSYSYS